MGKRETGSGEGRGGREAEADCGGGGGWQWRCQWLPFVRQFDEWMLLVAEGRGGETVWSGLTLLGFGENGEGRKGERI